MPKSTSIDDHVAHLVAEAPPLTTEQVDRLAALLSPARSQREAA